MIARPPTLVMLLGVILAGACSHSDSFPTVPDRPDGAFGSETPTRLTYNPGDDAWPAISGPGRLSYQFRRGTPDRDICAGVMPDGGGPRMAEACAWETDEASRSDLFGAAVLLDDGRFLWTRHQSGTGNQAPQDGGLYLGPRGSPRTAVRVLSLLRQPAGASARWDVLVDPVQTGPDEITALAAQWYIGPTIKFGPVDTIIRGVEIARISLTTVPATVTVLAPAPDAIAWARDAGSGHLYYARPTYVPPSEDSLYRPIADTVFQAGGGGGTPVWGRPEMPNQVSGRLEGLAVGGGRVFVAYRWAEYLPPVPPAPPLLQTTSRIVEITNGTASAPRASRIGTTPDHWGRLAITQDGSALIAESIRSTGRDLYRIGVTP
ncbi:MAG TPA: hypothetical protein VFN22_11205 [Gemmatimonadales bacterium]|nr:hypothetical protein [Gemmatimonadales bacterium]